MMWRFEKALESLGMTVTERTETGNGMPIIIATLETERGKIEVACGANGCARIDKPNKTHKWYYEKSPAQIRAAVKQTIDFWMN